MGLPTKQPYVRKIVIHHSAAKDTAALNIEGIREYHKSKGWIDIGYNFFIERIQGKLEFLAGRPMNRVGAHARGANTGSIGVCLMGNFSETAPDEALLDFAAYHVAGLVFAFDLRWVDIYPHREVGSTKTECPGSKFPWEEFIRRVKKYV